jgi:hypothetical protein
LISSEKAEEFKWETPEMNASPSKEITPDPSRKYDGDTIPSPELSLRVGERLRYGETEISKAWVEGDGTKTLPKKIRLNRTPT